MKGSDVTRIRSKFGLTQAQLAKILDKSVSQVSRYECAVSVPIHVRPVLKALDKSNYVSFQECNLNATQLQTELLSIVQGITSKAVLIRVLTFTRILVKRYSR